MTEIGIVIAFFVVLILVGWARQSLIERVAKPLAHTEERVDFPALVTLTVGRNEIPWLQHSGVYDGIAVQRNPNAIELRLINSTNSRTIDPYSFFVPRDETVLSALSKLLAQEAQRVEREGNPFFK
jgi:hypothetical protein